MTGRGYDATIEMQLWTLKPKTMLRTSQNRVNKISPGNFCKLFKNNGEVDVLQRKGAEKYAAAQFKTGSNKMHSFTSSIISEAINRKTQSDKGKQIKPITQKGVSIFISAGLLRRSVMRRWK